MPRHVRMRTTPERAQPITTHGVLIVKPRTAGMRETRERTTTENFMAALGGRQETTRGVVVVDTSREGLACFTTTGS